MRPGSRATAIAATLALHAIAVGVLLQFDAVRQPLAQAIPVMVNLITPQPKIEPPKPRPVVREPVLPVPQPQRIEPAPVLAVETAAAGPAWTVPAPPRLEPAQTAAVIQPVRVPAAVTASPPIVPPGFDAAYLQNPPPAYPVMSRRRGEQGRVLLRVFVSAAGAAERVEVRESSGFERLDRAAHDAVHNWRFVPARQGEMPVPAWVLVPIQFTLGG